MKKLIFVSIVLMLSIKGIAQVDTTAWCPLGATWVYSLTCQACSGAYVEFSYKGDTVILNTPTKILSVRQIVVEIDPLLPNKPYRLITRLPNEYVFSANDSVFLFSDTVFKFVYKFQLQIGDSFVVSNERSLCIQDTNYPRHDTVRVLGVGYDTIGSTILKRYIVSSYYLNTGNPFNNTGFLYENIGFSSALFPEVNFYKCLRPYSQYGGIGVSGFVCYSDNIRGTLVFNKQEPSLCHFIKTSILDEVALNKGYYIYPNPTKSDFSVVTPEDGQSKAVVIYNLLGERIMIASSQNKIDVGQLASGVYILHIFNENKIDFITKLIKE